MRARTPTRRGLRTVAMLLGAAGLGGACDGSEEAAGGDVPRLVAGSMQPSGDLATLAGTWSGTARVSVPWCRQTLIPVSLAITPRGRVTGRVGDAALVEGRLSSHRGSLRRRLGLSSDWLVSGELSGPVVAAEDVLRAIVQIHFDVVGGRLRGSLSTEGALFGGRGSLAFGAAFDDLSRASA